MVINIDHFTFIKSNYIGDELKVHVCIIFIKCFLQSVNDVEFNLDLLVFSRNFCRNYI